jgi:cobalt-zinc-cadmium efflux system outer membrane protein
MDTLANRPARRKMARIVLNGILRHRPSAIGQRRRAHRDGFPVGSPVSAPVRRATREYYPPAARWCRLGHRAAHPATAIVLTRAFRQSFNARVARAVRSAHAVPVVRIARGAGLARITGVVGAAITLAVAKPVAAQRAVTRRDAIDASLTAGTRVALARADSAAARARLLTARTLGNPSLAASWSKSAPQKHLSLEIPLDAPWIRGARVGAARAAIRAAELRTLSERASAIVEADTTYTTALAAEARFRLSRQTARDADSLRLLTTRRRDAGDASELDVDLATVAAGQQANSASNDSLAFMSALLALQTIMGMPADSVAIVLADSLRRASTAADTVLPSVTSAALPDPLAPPSVRSAEASLEAAELAIVRERRSVLGLPALSVGVEYGDPRGDEPGLLPTFGVVLPLPLLDRNRGPIAEATAERDRARAELAVARLEARQRLREGLREREQLLVRVARDSALVGTAQRVAARALTAYAEGASALPAVLEARRSAREVLAAYIDDTAALLIVTTELRALTQSLPVP